MSVQSEIDRINGAKSTIAANIKDSGVSVQEGARLEVLAPLVGDIVGQFSDELDMIIGGDTTPVTDITARLSSVNGVIGDVSTQLDTLDGTKTAIKDAIVAKGVEVPEGTVFRDYASKIGEIQAGSVVETAIVDIRYSGVGMPGVYLVDKDNNYVIYPIKSGDKKFEVNSPSIIAVSGGSTLSDVTYSGKTDKLYEIDMFAASGGIAFYVYGDCVISV